MTNQRISELDSLTGAQAADNDLLPIVDVAPVATTKKITRAQLFASAPGMTTASGGTAAAPVYAFAAQPNTGFYRAATSVAAISVNGVERMRWTTAGAELSGLLSGTAVTQSVADTTTGRLLKVGDFGLGEPGNAGTLLTTANAANALRGFRIDRAAEDDVALVGGPVGTTGGTFMTIGHSATNQHQLFFEVSGEGRAFQRVFNGTVWSAWVRLSAGLEAATFASRADALAASVPAALRWIEVITPSGIMRYRRTAVSTYAPLQTADGQWWEPADLAHLAHWGCEGVALDTMETADRFYLPTAPNEATTLQRAMDWSLSRGPDLYADPARVYGTNVPLRYCARTGFTDAAAASRLIDLNLTISGGTWPDGTRGADWQAWVYPEPVITVGLDPASPGLGKRRYSAVNLRVDCRRTAAVGVKFVGIQQGQINFPRVDRPAMAGIVIGEHTGGDPTVANDALSCTDSKFMAPGVREYVFGEQSNGVFVATKELSDGTGWWGLGGRTAHGLVIRSNDVVVNDPAVQTCLCNLVTGRGANSKVRGGILWTSAESWVTLGTTQYVAFIGEQFAGWTINDTRLEAGRIEIHGLEGSLIGCRANPAGFSGNAVRLVTSQVDERARRFTMIGCALPGNVLRETKGSGTWGNFEGMFGFNISPYNNTVSAINSVVLKSGNHELRASSYYFPTVTNTVAPDVNGQAVLDRTSETQGRIQVRGADAVSRQVRFPLANDANNVLYGRTNSVGTVSQSGGVPTGAIIERGAASGVEYVRYSDGTQICWGRATATTTIATDATWGFRSADTAVTFPVAFSATPRIVAAAVELTALGASASSISTTGFNIVYLAATSQGSASRSADWVATGRWF